MYTLEELKKLTLHDMRETVNNMSDEELAALHDEAERFYYPEVLTYPEFRENMKDRHYTGKDECFVAGCGKPAYYEGGDARYWCGMCEKHADIRYRYVFGLVYGEDSIRRKINFNLGDHQCQNSTK